MRLLQRRPRSAEDRLDVVGRARPAHLAAHQPEVRELELHVDRPRAHSLGLEALDDPFGKLSKRCLELGSVADIALERGFRRDRLRRLAAIDGRAVATLGQPLEDGAADSECLDEALGFIRGQLSDRAHTHGVKPLLGLGAEAGDGADGERSEKVGFGAWLDKHQAVRLSRAAGDLGDEFRGGRAHRRRQPNLGVDLELDPARNLVRRRGPVACSGGHVEIGLVEGDTLDQLGRGEAAEDLMDEPACLAISGAIGIDNHQLWAQLQSLVKRHRRAHAESARLVGSSHDDRPPRAPGHRDRYPAELGVVALVHRRVERVEVDVEDGARPVFRSGHVGCPASLPQQVVAYLRSVCYFLALTETSRGQRRRWRKRSRSGYPS